MGAVIASMEASGGGSACMMGNHCCRRRLPVETMCECFLYPAWLPIRLFFVGLLHLFPLGFVWGRCATTTLASITLAYRVVHCPVEQTAICNELEALPPPPLAEERAQEDIV
jgi:hypothetical protein